MISCLDLSSEEQSYFSRVLNDLHILSLEDMLTLIDDAWKECKCDNRILDDRISQFYHHPVWLLNGLFIEQHDESLRNRNEFANFVATLKPKRVADFGGGHGTLSRMIGVLCPDTEVHVVEPYPHRISVLLAERTSNVRYVRALEGEYDVIVATDVFEHVSDPLKLVEETTKHLRLGGDYLIANCFLPVLLCHLRSTFHFRWSWDIALTAMNLEPGAKVAYGRCYKRKGMVLSTAARDIESRSWRWFRLVKLLPIPEFMKERVARSLISEGRPKN